MSNFITRIDYSNNRQIKQDLGSLTELSGSTEFGITFSELVNGPDLTTSGLVETLLCINFTFSGNETEINFTFDDDILNVASHTLSPITNINSGDTQLATLSYSASTTTIIDDNVIALLYTGITYEVIPTYVFVTDGGFAGSGHTDTIQIYSAASLDYNARLIWVDVNGITRTERLIIKDGATVGKIYTCITSEGLGEWSDLIISSGTPINSSDSSGNIGNIQFDDNYIYWKTTSGWLRISGSTW